MESTVNSIHFLWAAYIVVIVANAGYILLLRSRWVKSRAAKD
jgi:hypothetical protein